MLQTAPQKGHSSVVKLSLEVHSTVVDLWKTGPYSITAKKPVSLPPGEGEIIITVDGNVRRSRVRLPKGMSPTDEVTPIELLAT